MRHIILSLTILLGVASLTIHLKNRQIRIALCIFWILAFASPTLLLLKEITPGKPSTEQRLISQVLRSDKESHVLIAGTKTRRFLYPLIMMLYDRGVKHIQIITVAGNDELEKKVRLLSLDPKISRISLLHYSIDYDRKASWNKELMEFLKNMATSNGKSIAVYYMKELES